MTASTTGSTPADQSTRHVVIIGGGLIGLTTALLLRQRGTTVTIIDAKELGSGASQGNAGFFAPGQLAPLAGPGMWKTALRSLLTPDAALRIKPSALPSMVGWGLTFTNASTTKRFQAGQAALTRLNARMEPVLANLESLGVSAQRGKEILVAFNDERKAADYLAVCREIGKLGVAVPAALLDNAELRRIAPALTDHVRAGFMFPDDRAADPRAYVTSAVAALRTGGTEILENHAIEGFDTTGGTVEAVRTNHGRVAGDEFVVAAGAGVRSIGRMLDLHISVIPGQGYNVALPPTDELQNPVIAEEVHAVATPLPDRIRLGGTMEFAGDNPGFDQRRVDAILRSMRPYFNLQWDQRRDTWAGSRPMSADGLPIVGRPKRYRNVVIGAGHGMFGYTLAPATAEAITELVIDGRSQTDLAAFDPDRPRLSR